MATDRFATGDALGVLVKQLEKRWGLALVSFLAPEAGSHLHRIQEQIARALLPTSKNAIRDINHYVDLYGVGHLHCTHLTLARSDPKGPVLLGDFVKPGHILDELFCILRDLALTTPPIDATLTKLKLRSEGLALVLFGKCSDGSAPVRRQLIKSLLDQLPKGFNADPRKWESDLSKCGNIHCCLGYIKRPLDEVDAALEAKIEGIQFKPVQLQFDNLTLVHYKRRSLVEPHEGSCRFTLGGTTGITRAQFRKKINLQ